MKIFIIQADGPLRDLFFTGFRDSNEWPYQSRPTFEVEHGTFFISEGLAREVLSDVERYAERTKLVRDVRLKEVTL